MLGTAQLTRGWDVRRANGKYRLLDLVALHSDSTVVGVIVKIEQNKGTILTTAGTRVVPVADVKKKLMSDGVEVTDSVGNLARQHDQVRHCLCLVCSTAFLTKTLPLPCVFHCLRD